jgi:hypothetical protein
MYKRFNFIIVIIVYNCLLVIFQDNFKLSVLFSFLLFLFIYFITKRIYFSIGTVFIISSQYLFPIKDYKFNYAYSYEYKYNVFRDGIIEYYGINLSDLWSGIFIIYTLSQYVSRRFGLYAETISRIGLIYSSKYVKIFCLSFLLFYIISFLNSVNISSFPTFSIYILFQYLKILFIAMAILIMYRQDSNRVYDLLTTLLVFQCVIGLVQFMSFTTLSGYLSHIQSLDVEESSYFYRVKGLMAHANQHALFVSVLLSNLLPFFSKRKIKKIIPILIMFNIVAAQSRTIWFGLGASIVGYFLYFRLKKIRYYLICKDVFNKRILLLSIGMFIVYYVMILPRLSSTSLFFSEEGGLGLRLKMIQDGLEIINDNPFFGIGAGQTVRVLLDRIPNGFIEGFPQPIHFFPIHILVEFGIIGSFFFILPIYFIIRKVFLDLVFLTKKKNPTMYWRFCGLLILVLYFFVQPYWPKSDFLILGISLGLILDLFMPTYDNLKKSYKEN